MSTPLRLSLLIATLTLAATALAQTIVNYDFGAVRINCPNGYAYQQVLVACPYAGPSQDFNSTPGFGWILGSGIANYGRPGLTLDGGPGLTGPNTIFFPPPFDGMPFNQAAILQDSNSFAWQEVSGFTSGRYVLSFYLGTRYSTLYDGNQTVEALIDGEVIGTWAMSSYTPFTPESADFTVTTDGAHVLEFRGMNHGDHTAFVSYVVITPTES